MEESNNSENLFKTTKKSTVQITHSLNRLKKRAKLNQMPFKKTGKDEKI